MDFFSSVQLVWSNVWLSNCIYALAWFGHVAVVAINSRWFWLMTRFPPIGGGEWETPRFIVLSFFFWEVLEIPRIASLSIRRLSEM